jgi:hypothetical protein
MDELDLIRSFRAADAASDPLARAAARERLLAHIASADHASVRARGSVPLRRLRTRRRLASRWPERPRRRSRWRR